MQFLIDLGLTFLYLCAFLLILTWVWRFWKMYVNQKYIDAFNKDCLILEIKLPREISKSPLATEIALASLLQGGGVGKWYDRDFKGNLPQYASLEIASLEGVIHFYIRAHKKFRPLIEANFYAQYPGIEIVEADDYTKKIRYNHLKKEAASMWGQTFKLAKSWKPTNPETGEPFDHPTKKDKDGKPEKYSMPADFYPMKTYVDFELDKNPDEEFKIDPITPLLEVMGGIGKGEYFWYQILLQDEGVYNDEKFPKFYVNEVTHKHVSLREMADAAKKQIRTAGYAEHGKVVLDEYGYEKTRKVKKGEDADGKPIFEDIPLTHNLGEKHHEVKFIGKDETKLTQDEKDDLEAINKKMSKPLALVVVRLVYVTKAESFKGNQIPSVLSFPKHYKGINSLGFGAMSDPYEFSWQNIGKRRSNWRAEEIFEEYVEREGFFPHIPSVMSKKRESLDKMEDMFFYPFPMKTRKMFRMMYEAIFHPFDHPHPDQVSIMNLEEVATLWHLPGEVAATPTLPRIDSVKGSAPSNLPV